MGKRVVKILRQTQTHPCHRRKTCLGTCRLKLLFDQAPRSALAFHQHLDLTCRIVRHGDHQIVQLLPVPRDNGSHRVIQFRFNAAYAGQRDHLACPLSQRSEFRFHAAEQRRLAAIGTYHWQPASQTPRLELNRPVGARHSQPYQASVRRFQQFCSHVDHASRTILQAATAHYGVSQASLQKKMTFVTIRSAAKKRRSRPIASAYPCRNSRYRPAAAPFSKRRAIVIQAWRATDTYDQRHYRS